MYSAALDAAAWPSALRTLAELLGSAGVVLEVHDLGGGGPPSLETDEMPAEGLASYAEYYHSVCPRIRALAEIAVGEIHYDYATMTEGAHGS